MGSLHWTEEQLAAFRQRKAELDARGTVRTHRVKDDDEVKFPPPKEPKPKKAQRKAKGAPRKASVNTVGVMDLMRQIEQQALPRPLLEHRFHPERKWRFDACWPDRKVALEVDGAIWIQGRHSRGGGMEKDNEKLNAAQILGWRVFRYSTGQVRKGLALADLRAVLSGDGWPSVDRLLR